MGPRGPPGPTGAPVSTPLYLSNYTLARRTCRQDLVFRHRQVLKAKSHNCNVLDAPYTWYATLSTSPGSI